MPRVAAGAAIGFVVGGLAGAAVGWAQGDDPELNVPCETFLWPFPCLPRVTRETKAVVHGLIGAPRGAIAGGIVGALVRTERWAVVPREQFRVAVVPLRGAGGATGVGFAISF